MKRPLFEQSIGVLLENTDLFHPASEALQKVREAKKGVEEAESGLRQQVESLNSRLALEIRRHNPALSVTMNRDGNCTIQYRSRGNRLNLRADPERQVFECGASPFERRFHRYHGHTLGLGVEVLGEAVAKFFKQNYRSIR